MCLLAWKGWLVSCNAHRCQRALPAVVSSRLFHSNFVSFGRRSSKTMPLSWANRSAAYCSLRACSFASRAFFDSLDGVDVDLSVEGVTGCFLLGERGKILSTEAKPEGLVGLSTGASVGNCILTFFVGEEMCIGFRERGGSFLEPRTFNLSRS